MATQEELDRQNEISVDRQRSSLQDRRASRDIRNAEKDALRGVTSTKERREIKAFFEAQQKDVGGIKGQGAIFDVSTDNYKPPENTSGQNTNVTEGGVHEIPRDRPAGGAIEIQVCDDATGSTQVLTVLTP